MNTAFETAMSDSLPLESCNRHHTAANIGPLQEAGGPPLGYLRLGQDRIREVPLSCSGGAGAGAASGRVWSPPEPPEPPEPPLVHRPLCHDRLARPRPRPPHSMPHQDRFRMRVNFPFQNSTEAREAFMKTVSSSHGDRSGSGCPFYSDGENLEIFRALEGGGGGKPRYLGPCASEMSDFPGEVVENGDMSAVMENLTQKSAKQQQQQISTSATASTSSSSSRISTSTSSSQRVHVTSSEMKASSMKSDLSELKSSISEMKNLSTLSNMAAFNSRLRSSLEELDRDDVPPVDGEPLVTFPDPDTPPPMNGTVSLVSPPLSIASSRSPPLVGTPVLGANGLALTTAAATSMSSSAETSVKFEQKRVSSASKTKVVTEGFTAEQQAAHAAEHKSMTAGEVSYQEATGVQSLRQRLEMEGLAAEKTVAMKQLVPCSDCSEDEDGPCCRTCRRRGDSLCLSMRFSRFLVIIRHGLDPFARHALPSVSLMRAQA
ncbi:NAD(+) hydrolase sarm1 [Frankliniella fusca]|uniref:NAD(+) hydrolase sarm1 n=1 Tax=Frankliniella fusca TaxID=407009 RepID=A0AAE1H4U6_9NEOP|nr:NAD(+) hydrolase sarm1 [Frankliniella fusca]